jgi:hypothetical protein
MSLIDSQGAIRNTAATRDVCEKIPKIDISYERSILKSSNGYIKN